MQLDHNALREAFFNQSEGSKSEITICLLSIIQSKRRLPAFYDLTLPRSNFDKSYSILKSFTGANNLREIVRKSVQNFREVKGIFQSLLEASLLHSFFIRTIL